MQQQPSRWAATPRCTSAPTQPCTPRTPSATWAGHQRPRQAMPSPSQPKATARNCSCGMTPQCSPPTLSVVPGLRKPAQAALRPSPQDKPGEPSLIALNVPIGRSVVGAETVYILGDFMSDLRSRLTRWLTRHGSRIFCVAAVAAAGVAGLVTPATASAVSPQASLYLTPSTGSPGVGDELDVQ